MSKGACQDITMCCEPGDNYSPSTVFTHADCPHGDKALPQCLVPGEQPRTLQHAKQVVWLQTRAPLLVHQAACQLNRREGKDPVSPRLPRVHTALTMHGLRACGSDTAHSQFIAHQRIKQVTKQLAVRIASSYKVVGCTVLDGHFFQKGGLLRDEGCSLPDDASLSGMAGIPGSTVSHPALPDRSSAT